MFNIHPVRSVATLAASREGKGPVRRVIIVDRDPDHCSLLLRHLVGAGFVVVIAQGWFEALSIIGRDAPDLAIFQRDGDDGDCDRAIALARMLYPGTHVVQTEPVVAGGNAQTPGALTRPVSMPQLDDCLRDLGLMRQL